MTALVTFVNNGGYSLLMVGATSFDISSCHQQPTIVASFFDNVNRLQMLHQQPSLTLTSWPSFFDNDNHLLLEDGLQMLQYKWQYSNHLCVELLSGIF
jgi:hypothetical protein